MENNKRYQVFSVKELVEGKDKKTVWVKAGSAWKNRDVMQGALLCGGLGNWSPR